MHTAINLNPLGLTAALVTFLSIWMGHAAVRRIEFTAPLLWPPAAGLSFLGLAAIGLSLWTPDRLGSTVLGILGITLLWDALELVRQARRVKIGRASANPANSRHASLGADPGNPPTSRQKS